MAGGVGRSAAGRADRRHTVGRGGRGTAARTGLAVVTSRRALGVAATISHGYELGPLKWRPAAALLADEQGGPLAGLPQAGELARVCGGLPLALRCAARLAPSDLSAARLAEQLDAGQAQLIARGTPRAEARVRAVIEAAIESLRPDTAQALRLLALCPGPEISTGLAAAVLRVSRAQAGAVLDALARAALLDQPDLSRASFTLSSMPTCENRPPKRWPLPSAGWSPAGSSRGTPRRRSRVESALARRDGPSPDVEAPAELSVAQAAGWADRHQPATAAILTAAVDRREHPAKALRLAGSLWPLLRARGDHDGQLTVARLGIRAARAHRDRAAEG